MPGLANKTIGSPVKYEFQIDNKLFLFSFNQLPALSQYFLMKVQVEDQDVQTSTWRQALTQLIPPAMWMEGEKQRGSHAYVYDI